MNYSVRHHPECACLLLLYALPRPSTQRLNTCEVEDISSYVPNEDLTSTVLISSKCCRYLTWVKKFLFIKEKNRRTQGQAALWIINAQYQTQMPGWRKGFIASLLLHIFIAFINMCNKYVHIFMKATSLRVTNLLSAVGKCTTRNGGKLNKSWLDRLT